MRYGFLTSAGRDGQHGAPTLSTTTFARPTSLKRCREPQTQESLVSSAHSCDESRTRIIEHSSGSSHGSPRALPNSQSDAVCAFMASSIGYWGPKRIEIGVIMQAVEDLVIETHARRPLPSYDAAVQEILDTEQTLPDYDPFTLRDDGAKREDVEYFLKIVSARQGREWEEAWKGEADMDGRREQSIPVALECCAASENVQSADLVFGSFSISDQVYFTGRRDLFGMEDTPKHGELLEVLAVDDRVKHENGRLLCCRPSKGFGFSVPAHLLSKSRPPPLPGGHEAGDFVYYVGDHGRFADGKRLRSGALCEVAGPAEGVDTSAPPSVLVLFGDRPRGEASIMPITQIRDQRVSNGSLPGDLLRVSAAAFEGRLGEVLAFLDHSAEGVNVMLEEGSTLLMQAALAGQVDTVAALVERKAKLDLQDADGQTALMCAVSAGCSSVVRLLLDSGANADKRDRAGRNARDLANAKFPTASPTYRPVLSSIIEMLDDFCTQMMPTGTRVVIHGLKSRCELNDTVGSVISFDRATGRYGVKPDAAPLRGALKIKSINLAEYLNRRPAVRQDFWLIDKLVVISGLTDRPALNDKQGTARAFDPATGTYKIVFDYPASPYPELPTAVVNVKFLRTVYEAYPKLFRCVPSTAPVEQANWLVEMCSSGELPDSVAQLLREGIDPDWLSESGITPLIAACEHDHHWELLLAWRADVNLAALDGTTPLVAACRAGNMKAVDRLLSAPSMTSVDQAGPGSVTPLLITCQSGHVTLVSRLLKAKADPFKVYEKLRDAEEWGTRPKCDKLLQDEMLHRRMASLQRVMEQSEQALRGSGRGADLAATFGEWIANLREAAQNALQWAERHSKGKPPPALHKKLESANTVQMKLERAINKIEKAECKKAQNSTSVLADDSRVIPSPSHVDRWLAESREGAAAEQKRRKMAEQERARQAAMAERPYSTPGPSHRAPQARTAKAVPTEARLVHEEFVSEEARQRRRLDGERKQHEEHEAKVARDQAAREQAAREEAAEASKRAEARQHVVPGNPKLAEVIDSQLSAPTVSKLSAGGCSAGEDDMMSVASQATSQMTLESTKHFHEQRMARGLHDKTELKHVVKHGMARPSVSSEGLPTLVHEIKGQPTVVTDADGKKGVSAWMRGERERE